MTLDDLIHYLVLRDYHLCGIREPDPNDNNVGEAALTWSVDSNVVVVVYWSASDNCFAWRLAARFLSKSNAYLTFKPLLLEQDIFVDRLFDALNAQIEHFYKWILPAHTEELCDGN